MLCNVKLYVKLCCTSHDTCNDNIINVVYKILLFCFELYFVFYILQLRFAYNVYIILKHKL